MPAGTAAYGATIVREGQLRIRAIWVGSATTAGQISPLSKAHPVATRMQNHAERFADRLVLPTLSLAVGTAGVTARERALKIPDCEPIRYHVGLGVSAGSTAVTCTSAASGFYARTVGQAASDKLSRSLRCAGNPAPVSP